MWNLQPVAARLVFGMILRVLGANWSGSSGSRERPPPLPSTRPVPGPRPVVPRALFPRTCARVAPSRAEPGWVLARVAKRGIQGGQGRAYWAGLAGLGLPWSQRQTDADGDPPSTIKSPWRPPPLQLQSTNTPISLIYGRSYTCTDRSEACRAVPAVPCRADLSGTCPGPLGLIG